MGKNWAISNERVPEAIAIGINQYYYLKHLKYAQRDAEAMETWFKQANFDQVFLFTEDSDELVNYRASTTYASEPKGVTNPTLRAPLDHALERGWG